MTKNVTMILSGFPKDVTLSDLAYQLDKLFNTDEIGTFRLRDLPDANHHKRQVAVDFTSGFDAMIAQDVLHNYTYTLSNGKRYILKAKIASDSMMIKCFPPVSEQDHAVMPYNRTHSGGQYNLCLNKMNDELRLILKQKEIIGAKRELVEEMKKLKREYNEMVDNDSEDKMKFSKCKKKTCRKSQRSKSKKRKKSKYTREKHSSLESLQNSTDTDESDTNDIIKHYQKKLAKLSERSTSHHSEITKLHSSSSSPSNVRKNRHSRSKSKEYPKSTLEGFKKTKLLEQNSVICEEKNRSRSRSKERYRSRSKSQDKKCDLQEKYRESYRSDRRYSRDRYDRQDSHDKYEGQDSHDKYEGQDSHDKYDKRYKHDKYHRRYSREEYNSMKRHESPNGNSSTLSHCSSYLRNNRFYKCPDAMKMCRPSLQKGFINNIYEKTNILPHTITIEPGDSYSKLNPREKSNVSTSFVKESIYVERSHKNYALRKGDIKEKLNEAADDLMTEMALLLSNILEETDQNLKVEDETAIINEFQNTIDCRIKNMNIENTTQVSEIVRDYRFKYTKNDDRVLIENFLRELRVRPVKEEDLFVRENKNSVRIAEEKVNSEAEISFTNLDRCDNDNSIWNAVDEVFQELELDGLDTLDICVFEEDKKDTKQKETESIKNIDIINDNSEMALNKISKNKPKFFLPVQKILKQMNASIYKIEYNDKQDKLLLILRKFIRTELYELLKNKCKLKTSGIINIFREQHPVKDDDTFIENLVKEIEAGKYDNTTNSDIDDITSDTSPTSCSKDKGNENY